MPGFDRVARLYRWAEYLALGPLLTQTRNHWLPKLTHIRQATIFGDGDGRFLARFLQQNPAAHAHAIDASPCMLKLLQQRSLFAAARRTTELATLPEALPAPDSDLLVTHFVLDCLPQTAVDRFAEQCFARTAPGTLWLVSDFAPMRSRWLRPASRLYIRLLYLSFRMLTGLRVTQLPDSYQALSQAGFQRIAHTERVNGLLFTELWRRP
ncbi:MAG: class I SAM-dependent methyltransferase [Acidobacteriaceae bacterium]|nr:class I SAM-dependent methyltransferase [Acidobacteriaceae bacterium]